MPTRGRGETDSPYVDRSLRGSLHEYLGRILEHATPDSYVSGGGSGEFRGFDRRPRNHDTLTTYREIYQTGGPITEFIDTRNLMTFGTGVEFDTTADLQVDSEGRTVAEHLADVFDQLDQHFLARGLHTYVYGDAWPELVETRGGDFSHVNLIDPTTVDVQWDRHGEVQEMRQIIVEDGRVVTQDLDPDRVGHYKHKGVVSSGPLGDSLIGQNHDEIMRFAKNQQQRENAIRLHGSPHYHVKVGSESQQITDRLLRRVRDQFRSDQTDEKTNWITGGDIEVAELDAPGFEGMSDITETDIAILANGFGVPLEWTNFGSDGLGSGAPAESRQTKFERQARAEQRHAAEEFLHEVIRPYLERYSPFPRDIDVEIVFGDVVSDQQAAAEWMRDFKSYLTPDEVREALNLGPAPEDEDLGPPEGTPDAEGQDISGGGGLFASDADATDDPTPADRNAYLRNDGGEVVGEDFRPAGDGPTPRTLLHDSVSADALTQEELVFDDLFERVLWHEDTSRQLFAFDPEEVPQFAIDRLRNAVAAGALFDDFETIPTPAASQVQDALLDSLETQHGWSIDSLANNLTDAVVGLDKRDAERIARTETQALVNEAREQGYEEQFDLAEERFKWVGPSDSRTTETCEAIKNRVGEAGVQLETLKETVQDVAREHGHDPREWTPHINCRHTYVRVV